MPSSPLAAGSVFKATGGSDTSEAPSCVTGSSELCSSLAGAVELTPLTFREVAPDARPPRFALPNQCGKPWRRLKPPGDSRSSSVALTGLSLAEPVLKV